MKNLGFLLKFVVVLSILLSAGAVAQAQATRTWVASNAGGGSDANPCSRTAPCLTFAGALSKTAEGGEIDVIEPGAYGAVTITKAITIDGGAGWAGIIASGGNGSAAITVNVTGGDHADTAKVILRNLTLNGVKQAAGPAGDIGIHVIKVSELHIENVNIEDFNSQGINIDGADAINVFINHVSLSHDSTGVRANTAAGFLVTVYMDEVTIQGNNNGLNAVANTFSVIRNSYFAENRGGTNGAVKVSSGCTVSMENNMFAGNTIAVNVASGGTANISNNSFYGNTTALSGAGTIATATNSNKFAANPTDGATNATITVK